MTAAFDATGAESPGGADQRFTDALSGFDGTGDPSVLMPVLDVYPDALSSPMPADLFPLVPPASIAVAAVEAAAGGGRASAAAPGRAQPARAQPARAQPARAQPAQRQANRNQPARNPPGLNQPTLNQVAPRGGQARPAYPTRPVPARQANPVAPTGSAMTANDFSAMFRNLRSGQSEQLDRLSYQATHPQSMGSTAPSAVAPAAPIASQYSARGQVRNTARDQAQERRRTSSAPPRRKSSVGAVLVFLLVVVFASGLGQRAIDLFNELFNR